MRLVQVLSSFFVFFYCHRCFLCCHCDGDDANNARQDDDGDGDYFTFEIQQIDSKQTKSPEISNLLVNSSNRWQIYRSADADANVKTNSVCTLN